MKKQKKYNPPLPSSSNIAYPHTKKSTLFLFSPLFKFLDFKHFSQKQKSLVSSPNIKNRKKTCGVFKYKKNLF